MCWRMDTPGCRLELIARCFPCIPNTWLHNWKLSEINRWVHLVVLGILPTDARYEVRGSTLSEVVLWTCSDRELHLKGSLAMLIRGLQNPFVTRSMSFQHEDVERSFYLVFVLSVPCSFFIYLLFSKWLLVKLMYLRNSFVQFSVRMILWRSCCTSTPLFRFDSGIRVASMSNVDSIPFLIGVLIFLWEC